MDQVNHLPSFLSINPCFHFYIYIDRSKVTKSMIQVFNSSLACVLLPIGSLGIDNDVKKLSIRIVIFFTCLFGALVYWSYCAVLVSLLTVSENPLTINKLEDLVGQNQYTLYYSRGTAAYNYFSKANNRTNKVAAQIFKEYPVGEDQNGKYIRISI